MENLQQLLAMLQLSQNRISSGPQFQLPALPAPGGGASVPAPSDGKTTTPGGTTTPPAATSTAAIDRQIRMMRIQMQAIPFQLKDPVQIAQAQAAGNQRISDLEAQKASIGQLVAPVPQTGTPIAPADGSTPSGAPGIGLGGPAPGAAPGTVASNDQGVPGQEAAPAAPAAPTAPGVPGGFAGPGSEDPGGTFAPDPGLAPTPAAPAFSGEGNDEGPAGGPNADVAGAIAGNQGHSVTSGNMGPGVNEPGGPTFGFNETTAAPPGTPSVAGVVAAADAAISANANVAADTAGQTAATTAGANSAAGLADAMSGALGGDSWSGGDGFAESSQADTGFGGSDGIGGVSGAPSGPSDVSDGSSSW